MKTADTAYLPTVKIPKSNAFPVDAIVTYSITSIVVGSDPPLLRPRMDDEQDDILSSKVISYQNLSIT